MFILLSHVLLVVLLVTRLSPGTAAPTLLDTSTGVKAHSKDNTRVSLYKSEWGPGMRAILGFLD